MSRTRFPPLGSLLLALPALVVGSVIWLRFDERGEDGPPQRAPQRMVDSVAPGSPTTEAAMAPIDAPESGADFEESVAREQASAPEDSSDLGSYVVEVVATDGSPVIGARANLFGEKRVRTTSADGCLRFDRPGAAGLLVADGFRPRSLQVPRGRETLELRPDVGLDVRVVWEDSGEPVAGARIRRHGLYDRRPLELLEELIGAEVTTDAEGRAHVTALHVDDDVVRLRFDHPQAAPTWQELGALLDDRADTPQLTVALPRPDGGARFHVVDASGAPIADRTVRVTWFGNVEARTGADGRAKVPFAVRNVDPDDWNFVAVTVRLEAEDAWWFAGMFRTTDLEQETELRVAPVRVHGTVVTSTPAAWQVTVASLHGGDAEGVPRSWPHADRLTWTDLGGDGSFDLTNGWQGLDSSVFLRARGSQVPLQASPIPLDGAAMVITPRPTCRVSVAVACESADDLAGGVLEILGPKRPDRAPDLFARIDPLLPVHEWILPYGRYDLRLRLGSSSWTLPEIDVQSPDLRVDVPWPRMRRVRGTVRSTILGPVAGAEVSVADFEKHPWATLHTDAAGRFEVDLPRDRRLRAFVLRELRSDQPRYVTTGFGIQEIAPDQDELHFVQSEAEVRVVEIPHQPLLADVPFELLGPHRIDGTAVQYFVEKLGLGGTTTLLLEPDTYAIRRALGDAIVEVPFTVIDGERREVVLDSSGVGPLALEVQFTPQPDLRLTAIAVDAAGRKVGLWNRQAVAESPLRAVLPVPAGICAVTVELHLSLDESASPIAAWSGSVDAAPGAAQPTVVDLR